jgi:RNA polymerase sigma-70 factor, ECF subfamily
VWGNPSGFESRVAHHNLKLGIPHESSKSGVSSGCEPRDLDKRGGIRGAGIRGLKLTGVPDEPELDPSTQFHELYDREYNAVYRAIRAVVLDAAAAEDLTQETFVRAYRARHRYKPTAPPGAWLRRIGVNLAISHLRRQKLARFLPARLYMTPDRREYDQAEARDVVSKALSVLSPKLRAAVVLHYYEGMTRDEIAATLGIPAGTVASRIAKAVAIMRRATESDQVPEPTRSTNEGALRGKQP